MKCSLCPRRCNAERTNDQNLNGFCKMPLLPKVARAALHFWEEPCISGKNGSGTVFFSGCTLDCAFCQNYDISHGGFGKVITHQRLADIFKELEDRGAHNINLVTPTHFVPAIIRALDIYKPKIPVVYNSGGYDSVEEIRALKGYVDIFLMDLKYLSGERAALYSGAPDYPEYAAAAIRECYSQQPICEFKDGIMKKGLIVRHLLLPQGTGEAIRVFDWVRDNTPDAYFSIMSQYTPCGRAENMPIINRRVTKREYDKVLCYICNTDFEKVYFQERESSDKKYIPPFDLSGV
ncbi:MAG: radical SAM protein [Acutalibacteraceae bacterium]